MSELHLNIFKCFLLVTLPYMNDIISISIYEELLSPIIKYFVTLKVLMQNERTQWFMVRTLCSTFLQDIMRV